MSNDDFDQNDEDYIQSVIEHVTIEEIFEIENKKITNYQKKFKTSDFFTFEDLISY
jgi:hypothetical protein